MRFLIAAVIALVACVMYLKLLSKARVMLEKRLSSLYEKTPSLHECQYNES